MPKRKTRQVAMRCDGCGRVRPRYPNAKFCYDDKGRICGRLRRVPPAVCPTCPRPWPEKEDR